MKKKHLFLGAFFMRKINDGKRGGNTEKNKNCEKVKNKI